MAKRRATPARARVQANLTRLLDARTDARAERDGRDWDDVRGEVRAEIAVAAGIGSDSMTPAQRGSNLGRIESGTKGWSPETLDDLARALEVDVSEFLREPRVSG